MASDGGGALACVEVGGSGCQTVVFDGADEPLVLDGAHQPRGAGLALAVPGIIAGDRVAGASNLGWYDVDPVAELGLDGPTLVLCNDAEAAAIGEAALRGAGALRHLVYLSIGTGVGGAVIVDGELAADNLFGHTGPHSERPCPCGRTGCLETVAAGWALPKALEPTDVRVAGRAIARALAEEPSAADGIIVIGGGVARSNPDLVDEIAAAMPDRQVEATAAPSSLKSAAALGLRFLATRDPQVARR
jgi:predicted NBD/HSP70 family sugar kinase